MKKGMKQAWARPTASPPSTASGFRPAPRWEGYLNEKDTDGPDKQHIFLTRFHGIMPSLKEDTGGEESWITIEHDGRRKTLADLSRVNRQLRTEFITRTTRISIVSAFSSTANAMEDLHPPKDGLDRVVCLCALAPLWRGWGKLWDGGALIYSIGSGSFNEFWLNLSRNLAD
ncbi:hypothetical protein ACQUQQ_08645 [Acidithiobacillus ferrooxidans]|uniref:hypothetical protein n=1 Tax=Acidithiobacillus ferrooxidans TaxID=920 RepID=UPI003D1652F5